LPIAERGPLGGLLVLLLMSACSQGAAPSAPPAGAVATVQSFQTPLASLEARFDPTAAVGGGVNSSGAISADEINRTFASVGQAAQLRFTANASPPGAVGPAVTSISITAMDPSGVLTPLDATAKKSLGEALLNAAAASWPQARITLLASGTGGQIIGTRPPGGPNTVIAT
jgi:hypothetical protein